MYSSVQGTRELLPRKNIPECLCSRARVAWLKISTVHVEYPFPEYYKGRVVGLRRADLLIVLGDEKLLFEFKNARQLNAEHMKQLQFCMHELKVQQGFLINLPKAGSFPDDHACDFATKVLQGSVAANVLEIKPCKKPCRSLHRCLMQMWRLSWSHRTSKFHFYLIYRMSDHRNKTVNSSCF